MRMLSFLLLAGSLSLCARPLAQKVSLSCTNSSLKQVFSVIEKQTGYVLFASAPVLSNAKLVTVSVRDMPLKRFLDLVMQEQPLSYFMEDSTIMLFRKPVLQKGNGDITAVYAQLPVPPLQGRLRSIDGAPLQGVAFSRNNAVIGLSDAQGRFSLNVAEGDVITVSAVGFMGLRFRVVAPEQPGQAPQALISTTSDSAIFNGNTVRSQLQNAAGGLDIFLIPKVALLNEVAVTVNTGYQILKKDRTTGAVVTLSAEELEKRNTVNIADNLEGTVPGLIRYGGRTTIRGVSTMQANEDVLVVVDGLPIEGSIANINPYDVETITVLKDAAAASIYGARASNGVIVVTTKRAKVPGKTVVEYGSNITVTNKPDYSYSNMMSAAEQVDYEKNYNDWWFNGAGGTVADPVNVMATRIAGGTYVTPVEYAYYRRKTDPSNFSEAQLNTLLQSYRGNNFLQEYKDNALRNQVIQQHNLAIRTNSGRSQSSLIINYTTDNGGIINAFNRQWNLFYKGDYRIGKWLNINYGVNSVIGRQRAHNSSFAKDPYNVPAYLSLFNTDGSHSDYSMQFNQYNTITETTTGLYSLKFNHLDELNRDFVNTSVMNTRYFLNMDINLSPELSFRPMFQYEDDRTDQRTHSEAESYTMRWLQDVYTTRTGTSGAYSYTNLLPQGGMLATSYIRKKSYTARAQAEYKKELGKHSVNALAGMEFREVRSNGTRGVLLGYDDQLQLDNTANVNFATLYGVTSTFLIPGYSPRASDFQTFRNALGVIAEQWHRFGSAYANLTYSYNRRFNVFGSVRKDYADLFGGDDKYRGRPLWSAGASWVASEENFIRNLNVIDYVNVRGSYGLTGNIDPNTSSRLVATVGRNGETTLPNASVATPPNASLRWEKTETINLGMDFRLLGNKLRGSVDWYRRKGTDLLARKRLDPSHGFTSMVINNAGMLNNGWEFNLGYDWFKTKKQTGFNWSSNLNFSYNRNRITYVDEVTRSPYSIVSGDGFREGFPVRSLFSYQFAGLNENGMAQWYGANGVKTTAQLGTNDIDAIVFSGAVDPKLNIGFNNDFSYKGLSLSVFTVYYSGHSFRALQVPDYAYMNRPLYGALPNYLLRSWTPESKDTYVPGSGRYYRENISNTQFAYADFAVRPADFIKIRNLVLGYQLPQYVAAKIKATGIRLRAQVNNPGAIWTRVNDVRIDPETGGAPIATSYVLGINVNF